MIGDVPGFMLGKSLGRAPNILHTEIHGIGAERARQPTAASGRSSGVKRGGTSASPGRLLPLGREALRADSGEGLRRNPRRGEHREGSYIYLGDEAEEVVGDGGVLFGGHGGGSDGGGGLREVLVAEVRHDEGVHLPQQLRLLHRRVHLGPDLPPLRPPVGWKGAN